MVCPDPISNRCSKIKTDGFGLECVRDWARAYVCSLPSRKRIKKSSSVFLQPKTDCRLNGLWLYTRRAMGNSGWRRFADYVAGRAKAEIRSAKPTRRKTIFAIRIFGL